MKNEELGVVTIKNLTSEENYKIPTYGEESVSTDRATIPFNPTLGEVVENDDLVTITLKDEKDEKDSVVISTITTIEKYKVGYGDENKQSDNDFEYVGYEESNNDAPTDNMISENGEDNVLFQSDTTKYDEVFDVVLKYERVKKQDFKYVLVVLAKNGDETGTGVYLADEEITLTATPKSGYAFDCWEFIAQNGATIEDENSSTTTLTMPSQNVAIRANFVKEYKNSTNSGVNYNTNTVGGEKIDSKSLIKDLAETLEFVHYDKYMEGYEDGSFRPNEYMTRAEVFAIIYNLSEVSEDDVELSILNQYEDVSKDVSHATAIAYVLEKELIVDFKDGMIRPNCFITRGEIASLLNRAYNRKVLKSSKNNNVILSDIKGHWAENDIQNLINADVINGYKDGTFKPNNAITRAEIAIFVNHATNRPNHTLKSVNYKDLVFNDWAYNEIQVASNNGCYVSNLDDVVNTLIGYDVDLSHVDFDSL